MDLITQDFSSRNPTCSALIDMQSEFLDSLSQYFKSCFDHYIKVFRIDKFKKNGDYTAFLANDDKVRLLELPISTDLPAKSQSWRTPVGCVDVRVDNIVISLDRPVLFRNCIYLIKEQNEFYGHSPLLCSKTIKIITDLPGEPRNPTEMRTKMSVGIIRRLMQAMGATVTNGADYDYLLHLGLKAPNEKDSSLEHFKSIKVSKVLNADSMTPNDYFMRTTRLMELQDNMNFSLGKEDDQKILFAILRFELFLTKLSQPVSLNSTKEIIKGAVYVMYNFVRLKAILVQFDTNVALGIYPPLPPFEEIDFQQLTCEEEWHLMFCYLFDWPRLVKKAYDSLSSVCQIHSIFIFLSKLSSNFSSYYGKERILTENRKQLLPIMFARICLIKAIVRVMENAFNIVGISPLSRM